MSGSQTTKSTSSNTVNPAQMAEYQANYQQAQTAASQPYSPPSQLVAPLNATQQQGFQGILDTAASAPGSTAVNNAVAGTQGILNYQAPTVSAPTIAASGTVAAPTVTPQSITAASAAKSGTVTAGQLSDTNLSPYMSPYTNDVLNSTNADLNNSYQQALTGDAQRATQENAFGGSRADIADSQTTNDYLRNLATTDSGILNTGYTNAQNAALTDIGNNINTGEFNTTATNNVNTTNAGLAQQAALANQSANLTGQQTNASNAIQSGEFNTSAQNAINAQNSSNALTASNANAGNANTAAGLNLNAAGVLNTLGTNQQNMAYNNANAVSAVGNAQQAQSQNVDSAAYQDYLNSINYQMQMQQLKNQSLGMIPVQQTTKGTSTQTTNPGLVGILGALGSVGQGVGSIMAAG